MIPKPDIDVTESENYRQISLMNIDTKKSSQNTSEQNPTHQRIIHYDQVSFIPVMQEFFSICKSISVIHHFNKLKDKNDMIISTVTEKAFDKIQHPFMIKTLQRMSIEGT